MNNRRTKVSKYRSKRKPMWEYRLYFTIIFIVGLIPATGYCFLARFGILKREKNWNGIIRCAWGKAQEYTPMIFSA